MFTLAHLSDPHVPSPLPLGLPVLASKRICGYWSWRRRRVFIHSQTVLDALARDLAEIARLGITMGARAETFAGLSGIGDLITTCSSKHSRNRYVGEKIGKGETLTDILAGMKMVAEGVETTRSGYALAGQYSVEMPITTEVFKMLVKDKPPAEAVGDLMGRSLKAEIWR